MTAMPAAPALADGAASTRNILIGGAAATLLIINHNKKVHQKEDEMARRQASAEANANDAWAAYSSEKRAYENQSAIVSEYKHEVAVQHGEIAKLRSQVAAANQRGDRFKSQLVHQQALARPAAAAPVAAAAAPAPQPVRVATVTYGWGNL